LGNSETHCDGQIMKIEPASEGAVNSKKNITLKIFGIGGAGVNVAESLIKGGLPGPGFVAVNTDAVSLAGSSAPEKVCLETAVLRGLGTGGDPERGRTLAEEQAGSLRTQCEGAEVVFILAGMGGGAGTGISPVVARVAKEAGALVLGFVARGCAGSNWRGMGWRNSRRRPTGSFACRTKRY